MKQIECIDVTKSYGREMALFHVNCVIEAGKVYALCGSNGAGKTTLLRTMADLQLPDMGSVRIDGQLLRCADRRRIAYLSDESSFTDLMRVGKVRLLYETFYDDFDPAACGRRLDRFGFRDQMVLGAMSRGMRTLLELIFVLSRKAELFLLDEPFAALDPQRREEAMQLIMEAQGEAAVVISTHLPGEIDTYLDRMLILQNGRLCIDEDADALRTRFGCGLQDLVKRYITEERG